MHMTCKIVIKKSLKHRKHLIIKLLTIKGWIIFKKGNNYYITFNINELSFLKWFKRFIDLKKVDFTFLYTKKLIKEYTATFEYQKNIKSLKGLRLS